MYKIARFQRAFLKLHEITSMKFIFQIPEISRRQKPKVRLKTAKKILFSSLNRLRRGKCLFCQNHPREIALELLENATKRA